MGSSMKMIVILCSWCTKCPIARTWLYEVGKHGNKSLEYCWSISSKISKVVGERTWLICETMNFKLYTNLLHVKGGGGLLHTMFPLRGFNIEDANINMKLLLKFKILGCRSLMGFPIIHEGESIESQVFMLKLHSLKQTWQRVHLTITPRMGFVMWTLQVGDVLSTTTFMAGLAMVAWLHDIV